MVSNPNDKRWAPIKALGIDPTMAITAAATGTTSLLSAYAQIVVSNAEGRSASNTALAHAQAKWAETLSASMGGKLSPADILTAIKIRNNAPTGKKLDPNVQGALDLIDNAMELNYAAAVTEAYKKGNPQAIATERLISLAGNTKDKNTFNLLSDEITRDLGGIQATRLFGPRPLLPGPEQTKWDEAAKELAGQAPKVSGGFMETLSGFFNAGPKIGPAAVMGQPTSPMSNNPNMPGGQQQPVVQQPPVPAANGPVLTDEQRQAVAGFLQSLQQVTPPPTQP